MAEACSKFLISLLLPLEPAPMVAGLSSTSCSVVLAASAKFKVYSDLYTRCSELSQDSNMSAAAYRHAQSSGAQVSSLINPVNGYRDKLKRSGVAPRNHAKENMQKLRQVQRENREAREEKLSNKGKNRFVMKRFKDVEARVGGGGESCMYYGAQKILLVSYLLLGPDLLACTTSLLLMQRAGNTTSRDTSRSTYLRKSARAAPPKDVAPFVRQHVVNKKAAVPKANEVNQLVSCIAVAGGQCLLLEGGSSCVVAIPRIVSHIFSHDICILSFLSFAHGGVLQAERSSKDFVSHNRREMDMASPSKAQPQAENALHNEFGSVPEYLVKRQHEWEEEKEEKLASMPDKDCPPGMVLMPESERKETLAVLLKSQEAAKDQLSKMPLVIETHGQVRRKNDLDAKLKEIEDAIAIFSREKVFVKDD